MESLKKLMIDQPSDTAFTVRFLGLWTVTPEEDRLRQLAEEYHNRCEEYDRIVCSGTCQYDKKTAMPIGMYEEGMVRRNAHEVFQKIAVMAEREGYTSGQLRRAISTFFER